jgi:hypothetical protein
VQVDNTKVFYLWMFGASGAVVQLLRGLWRGSLDVYGPSKTAAAPAVASSGGVDVRRVARRIVAAAVFLTLVFSGTLCAIGETLSFTSLYDAVDMELAQWLMAHTPIDARIATTSEGTHMRPVCVLCLFCQPFSRALEPVGGAVVVLGTGE